MRRRQFLEGAGKTVAGGALLSSLPFAGYSTSRSAADKIQLGLIGCRNMGFGVLKHAVGFPDVECAALCDVDETVLNQRSAELSSDFGAKPKLYSDFRKLLENKDVDAVIIGTPDHWHCLQTVSACQAGKDVYVEKPMANTIAECNLMMAAAKRYGRVVQVGQQQRSSPIFIKAMDLIKQGNIGNIRKVNIWANFNYGVGPKIVSDSAVPAGVDYNMWLGPAPERPFNQNRFHGTWRHFWDYGGGLMSDWGVHLIDMALWATNIVEGPKELLVYGANTTKEARARETFDTMSIVYPQRDFVINYDMNAGVQRGPWDKLYGLAFIGDKGTLVVNRNYLEVFPEWDDDLKVEKTPSFSMTQEGDTHKHHVRNFLDCIKSRETPACPVEVGRAAALYAHMANIAARVKAPHLKWNERENLFDNKDANTLITPQYRKPWTLPSL